jgi:hypothetical protein
MSTVSSLCFFHSSRIAVSRASSRCASSRSMAIIGLLTCRSCALRALTRCRAWRLLIVENRHHCSRRNLKAQSLGANADSAERRRTRANLHDVVANDLHIEPHRALHVAQHGMIGDAHRLRACAFATTQRGLWMSMITPPSRAFAK